MPYVFPRTYLLFFRYSSLHFCRMCYYRHYTFIQCGHDTFGANVIHHCQLALDQMKSPNAGSYDIEDSMTPPTTPIVGKSLPSGCSIQVAHSYPSLTSSQFEGDEEDEDAVNEESSVQQLKESCRKQRHGYRSLNKDGLCLKCKCAGEEKCPEKRGVFDTEFLWRKGARMHAGPVDH